MPRTMTPPTTAHQFPLGSNPDVGNTFNIQVGTYRSAAADDNLDRDVGYLLYGMNEIRLTDSPSALHTP